MTDKAIKQAAWTHYGITLPSLYVDLILSKRMRFSEAIREFLSEWRWNIEKESP